MRAEVLAVFGVIGLAAGRAPRDGDSDAPALGALELADVLEVLDELVVLDELEDELDESVDESAHTVGADASATPTPRVTARAPTRPMCLA